jgi:hypothetical protein
LIFLKRSSGSILNLIVIISNGGLSLKKASEVGSKKKGASWLVFNNCCPGGKTYMTIKTAPKPMAFFNVDDRDTMSMIKLAGESDKNVHGYELDYSLTPLEMLQDLSKTLGDFVEQAANGKLPYKTLFFDSMSCYANITVVNLMEMENYNAGVEKDESLPIGTSRALNWNNYNFMGSNSLEITKLLKTLTQYGVNVIVSAHGTESDIAKPYFTGKKYDNSVKHLFDYIGYVTGRYDDEGMRKYPSAITFSSEFALTRYSGKAPKPEMPFDWNYILKYWDFI